MPLLDPAPLYGPLVEALQERGDSMRVLVLPEGSSLAAVERAVAGLILDRESQVQRRAAEVYQDLIQLALEDVPVQSLAEALAQAEEQAKSLKASEELLQAQQ